MTAPRNYRCPRCHAAPGQPCTPSAPTLHTLDRVHGIVHAARTVLAGYGDALAHRNGTAGDGVTVWVDDGARWHPDGRVSLGAYGCGQLVRPYIWHPYRGEVSDYRARVIGAALNIVDARDVAAVAYLGELDTLTDGGTL
jgi:hypothetical protein